MSGKSMSHILSRLSSPLDLSKHDLTPSLPQEHTHNTHTQVHFNTVSTFGKVLLESEILLVMMWDIHLEINVNNNG